MLFCLDFLCLLFLPFLDKYTIATPTSLLFPCHAPWMMLANIGINQSALFWQSSASITPRFANQRQRQPTILTSKASKLAQIKPFRYRFCRVANAFNRLCDFSSLNNSSICQRQRYNAITFSAGHRSRGRLVIHIQNRFPLQTNVL